MIEIRHLQALQAIAHLGSLTAAAKTLHCTQSALSHLLADVERKMKLTLLHREERPLRFTAAGRRLLALADTILPALATAEGDLGQLRRGTTGRLLISLECHSCFDWLVPTLDAYRSAHPDVELDLRVGASFEPLPALRDGLVDLVITSERASSPGVCADPLFRYEIVAILPPGHPLAAKPRLMPQHFATATLVTYPVDEARLDLYSRFLRPAGIAPAKRRTAELTAMIVQLVASGHGLAALPRWAVSDAVERSTVVARPLGRTGLWSDLHALRRKEQVGLPYLDAFIAMIRRMSFRCLSAIKPVPSTPRRAQHLSSPPPSISDASGWSARHPSG